MTTYNTQNPVGSADPRDLYDNAQVIDDYANSDSGTTTDRLGVERATIAGIDSAARAAIANAGYEFAGDYAAGIELTAYNQVVREAGEFWRVSGAIDLPYTTTGAGMAEGGAFVSVGDASLRQDLVQPVATFNNVQDMKDAAGLDVGRKVRTLGYYAPGDGGGNDYEIVAAATSTDDGGSFIDLPGSGLQAKGIFTSDAPVTPMKYGARGDGVEDDTSAVQSCVSNHRWIADSNHVFRAVSEIAVPKETTIGKSEFYFDPPADGLLNLFAVRGQTLGTVALSGNAAYGETSVSLASSPPAGARFAIIKSDGVWANDGSDIITKGVFIEIKEAAGTTINLFDFLETDLLVSDNAEVEFIDDSGAGVSFSYVTARSSIDTGESDFTPFYFEKSTRGQVANCNARGFGRQGCAIINSCDIAVTGNTFEETAKDGFGYGTAIYSACKNIRFTNNTVSTARTACTVGGNFGITFDVVMSDNIATNLFGAAFGSKASCVGLLIANNICRGDSESTALQDGIRPRGKNIVVADNYIIGFNRYSIIASMYGESTRSGSKIVVSGNIIEQAKNIAIYIQAGGDGDVSGVVATGNIINFAPGITSASVGAIHVRSGGQAMKNVNIAGNTVEESPFNCVDVRGSGGTQVVNLIVAHNILERSAAGISAGRAAVVTVGTSNELITPNITV